MLYSRTPFDHLTENIPGERRGSDITEGELYFWANQKREENLIHIRYGHDRKYGLCPSCGNCLCGNLNFTPLKSFRCLCAFGKTMVTPHKVRSRR